jgi:hypothetical protein
MDRQDEAGGGGDQQIAVLLSQRLDVDKLREARQRRVALVRDRRCSGSPPSA